MNFGEIRGRYKQIDGFEDYYITEFGEIYSTRLRGYEKEHRLRKLTPKNPGKDSKYLNVVLCRNNEQVTKSIHRLVAEYFVDGYFDGAVVNHIDGNNRNNAASNLEWTTVADNVHKSYKTSGIGAKRNYYVWVLYAPESKIPLGSFEGHNDLAKYIVDNKLDTSPSWLIKSGQSRGYRIEKQERAENCNDYPKGVAER